jgi:hypothetical protein
MSDDPVAAAAARRLMFEALMSRSAEREACDDIVVMWVFRNYQDNWCVRQEGGAIEASFAGRKDAIHFARSTAHSWGAYRLFIQLPDGRIARELCNIGCHPST